MEPSLIWNPKDFKEHKVIGTGLGGKQTETIQTKIDLKIGQLPQRIYSVMIIPVPEYIIMIDNLVGRTLNIEVGRYQFGVYALKLASPVIVGKLSMTPKKLLAVIN